MEDLILKKNEERRIRAGHLWVFSNEVNTGLTPLKGIEPGAFVNLKDARGNALGTAYVNPGSLIAARLVSRKPNTRLGAELLKKRFETALALRQALFKRPYYRLVHAEGDFLPGLIIDRYGDNFAVQITTAGIERLKPLLCETLRELFPCSQIIFRNDTQSRTLENLEQNIDFYPDAAAFPNELEVEENGMKYLVPARNGQKTGWFYDQRLNRTAVCKLAAGLTGGFSRQLPKTEPLRMLDAFSYAGGFGVAAASGGISEITFLDASQAALNYAANNLERNAFPHAPTARCLTGDALSLLDDLGKSGENFDLVSVDPPAFIKRKKDEEAGLAAYFRVNELGLALVRPGGFYISSSCSQHLDLESLRRILQRAAARIRRNIQIIGVGRQGPDHPAHPAMPETEYLKALLLKVS